MNTPMYNLAHCFQPVLKTAARIGLKQPVPSREELASWIQTGREEAQRLGYSAVDAELAAYAVVALLDDIIIFHTEGSAKVDFNNVPLERTVFRSRQAATQFLMNLTELLQRPETAHTIDVIEVYCMCVLLGFGSTHRNRQALTQECTKGCTKVTNWFIANQRVGLGRQWVPTAFQLQSSRHPWFHPMLLVCAGIFVVCGLVFLLYNSLLNRSVAELAGIAATIPR